VFGMFQIERTTAFDENDRLFIKVAATQLGSSLDRHHSQLALEATSAKVEQANRVLHDLQTISKAALDGATLEESLAEVLHAMRSMFATDGAAVLLVSADGKTLRRRASSGLEDHDDLETLVGTGAAGRIAANGTAMCFDDFDDLGASPSFRSKGIHSLLGAPMRARNQVTGVVYVASREPRNRAWPRDRQGGTAFLLGRLRSEDGYDTEVEPDGAAALARLAREPIPDPLITDYHVPGADGLVIARHARLARAGMQVFVVTGDPRQRNRRAANSAGRSDCQAPRLRELGHEIARSCSGVRMIAQEIRGRLHAARLHLAFLERAFQKPDDDSEIVGAITAAVDELRQLERLVLAHLVKSAKPEGKTA